MANHRFFQVTPRGELQQKGSVEEAVRPKPGGGYAWLDFRNPSREDLKPLVELLWVHSLSIDDCLDEAQVPKIDNFDRTSFLLLNSFFYKNGTFSTGEIDFIIGSNFLVTVGGHAGSEHWQDAEVDSVLKRETASLGQGPDFLLHALLDHVMDAKHKAISLIESEVDGTEESIIRNPSGFEMSRLVNLRRNILLMRKSLFYEREILIKLCRRDSPFVSEKAIYHFRDVYDHLTKYYEEAEIYREVTLSLTEMYLSLVNNHMSRTANRTNATVSRLTFITTIFMPLTLLSGIGGMSEWSMMTGPENWRIAYPVFLVGMAVIGACTYAVLNTLDKKTYKKEEQK
ncbi:MAG TPA: magnesium transporter CorA family protein [Elusimicrobiales bacterium]|nr:magnesium transporter CorA family protein [Elusimicrobiales bacterium]